MISDKLKPVRRAHRVLINEEEEREDKDLSKPQEPNLKKTVKTRVLDYDVKRSQQKSSSPHGKLENMEEHSSDDDSSDHDIDNSDDFNCDDLEDFVAPDRKRLSEASLNSRLNRKAKLMLS